MSNQFQNPVIRIICSASDPMGFHSRKGPSRHLGTFERKPMHTNSILEDAFRWVEVEITSTRHQRRGEKIRRDNSDFHAKLGINVDPSTASAIADFKRDIPGNGERKKVSTYLYDESAPDDQRKASEAHETLATVLPAEDLGSRVQIELKCRCGQRIRVTEEKLSEALNILHHHGQKSAEMTTLRKVLERLSS